MKKVIYDEILLYQVTHFSYNFSDDIFRITDYESAIELTDFEDSNSFLNIGFRGELERIYNYLYGYLNLSYTHELLTKNVEIYENIMLNLKDLSLKCFYKGKIIACKLVDYVLSQKVVEL